MRKPRVLWIYGSAEPAGGSLDSVLDQLRYRDSSAFECIALVPGDGRSGRRIEAMDVPLWLSPSVPTAKSPRYLRAIGSFARRLRRNSIDLVYFADYTKWRPSELLGALLARVPVIVHLRSVVSDAFAAEFFLRGARAILGNSRATIGALHGRIPEDRLHVVHGCIDFERFTAGPDHRGRFFPATAPLTGFVGFFRPEKGFEEFLDMVAIVRKRRPEVRHLAVGGNPASGGTDWLARMRERAAHIGVSDIVRFLGERHDIPEIMRSIDILVVPSLTEGFARVVLEANAVGTPVVANEVGGMPEVVEDGVNGLLVRPHDPHAMADAVIRALDDADWRKRVAATAPARIRQQCAPEQQMAAIEAIWRQVLAA